MQFFDRGTRSLYFALDLYSFREGVQKEELGRRFASYEYIEPRGPNSGRPADRIVRRVLIIAA